jgi:hypothetical protein
MADSKITALTALTAADPVNDMFPVVDVSDTSMAASGTTKRISANNILSSSPTASGALTVTGLVTAGSATITGDLTVDTSTLKVDSTNDRVGIGTASPALPLDVVGGIQVTSGSAGGLYQLAYGASASSRSWRAWNDVSANGDFQISTSTTRTGSTYSDRYRIDVTGIHEWFNTSGTAMTLNSSGNLAFANTKGIDFSATANSSGTMTSELLNDYEEGTWTPVVADATTGGNVGTATINSATYTKIGRQVSIQCDLRSITTTGMTGGNNLFIRGLPFASVKGGNGSFYTYRVGRNASTVSSAVTVEHGVSHAILSLFTASSANTNISILVSDIVSTTSELALSVTYTV